MQILALIGFAYLLGSIPTGYVLGKLSGVDVRQIGSGNVGATNVARAVGKWQGVVTLLADAAKGMVPVAIGLWMQSAAGGDRSDRQRGIPRTSLSGFLEISRRQGSRDRVRRAFNYCAVGNIVIGRGFRCGGFSHPIGFVELDNRRRHGAASALDFFSAPCDRLDGRFSCRDDRLASSRQYSAVVGRHRAAFRRALVLDNHFDPAILLAPALGVVARYRGAGAESLR